MRIYGTMLSHHRQKIPQGRQRKKHSPTPRLFSLPSDLLLIMQQHAPQQPIGGRDKAERKRAKDCDPGTVSSSESVHALRPLGKLEMHRSNEVLVMMPLSLNRCRSGPLLYRRRRGFQTFRFGRLLPFLGFAIYRSRKEINQAVHS